MRQRSLYMNKFKIKSTIYHGTIYNINNINLTAGRGYKDFGKGFYLAYNKEQSIGIVNKAYKIALKRKQSNIRKNLYAFDTSQEKLEKCRVKVFNSANVEWLDFILKCRKSPNTPHEFDVVIGPTADDDTSLCLNMYNEGVYGTVGSDGAKQTLLRNLEVENLGTQVFIGTQKGLSILCNQRRVDIKTWKKQK